MIGIQKRTILWRVLFVGAMLAECIEIEKIPARATNAEYVPPPRPERIRRTEGAGSRGNCFTPVALSLLAPKDRVGLTVAERPTFLWYASSANVPLRFTLVEPGVAEPIIDRQIKINKPGIVRFQVPSIVAPLQPNKEYQWAVSAMCNNQRPSANIYARATIATSSMPPALAREIERAATEDEKARIYARAGMWYDAIGCAYNEFQNTPEMISKFCELLDKIGLGDLAIDIKEKLASVAASKSK